MAKKKQKPEEVTEIDANNPSEALIAKLTKDYGDGCVISGNIFSETKREIVSVSPAIDIGLGGGVPTGSWFTLNGPPKRAKSSTALQFAANYQKLGRRVYFMNIEARLKERDLKGIHGLNINSPHFNIIQSSPSKIMSGKDYLQVAEHILKTDKGCLIIFDSFSRLIDERENTDGLGSSGMGSGQKMLAQFCRLLAPVVSVNDCTVVGITHVIANLSGYGAKTVEQSGFALQYAVDVKLKAKTREYWQENKKTVGQRNTWIVETSALGAPPCEEVTSCLRYGYGLDEVMEVMTIGMGYGLIEKAGAWYTLSFLQNHLDKLPITEWNDQTIKPYKANGEAQTYELLKENPEWVELLYNDVKAMLL